MLANRLDRRLERQGAIKSAEKRRAANGAALCF
jgi:hypothetical protein